MNTHSGGFPDGNLRQLQQPMEALGLKLDYVRDWLDDRSTEWSSPIASERPSTADRAD
jgi:hypothetical protein